MNLDDAMNARSLEGKVALVTGSTSSLGFRIAEALALRGAKIALNGRSEEKARPALERMKEIGVQAIFEPGDANVHSEIARAVQSTEQRLGPIDILVASGGTTEPGPTLFHNLKPDEVWQSVYGRFMSRANPVHAAITLSKMRERETGSIVLVSSDAARYPTPGESMVGAAGAGVMLMTKTLAKEFSRWKIRINTINITLTSDTTRFEEHLTKPGHANNIFTKAVARFPFGAPPSASQVAHAAAFLASDEASQITGQTLSVNGGLSFGGW